MTIYAECETLSGGCGISTFCEFTNDTGWSYNKLDIKDAPHNGGAGWLIVHFVVGNKMCDEVYKIMKKRFPIAFESPKRLNVNSKHKVYFCVYDTHGVCEYGFDAVAMYEDARE